MSHQIRKVAVALSTQTAPKWYPTVKRKIPPSTYVCLCALKDSLVILMSSSFTSMSYLHLFLVLFLCLSVRITWTGFLSATPCLCLFLHFCFFALGCELCHQADWHTPQLPRSSHGQVTSKKYQCYSYRY